MPQSLPLPTPSPSPCRQALAFCLIGIAASLAAFPAAAQNAGTQNAATQRLDVPYQPSPQYVVNRMLRLADVGKDDVLYDLGSGDGRIVITAAKEFGARGVGIDLDPKRVAEAKANAKKAGVEDKVQFIAGDLFKADFSDATVVTLFLFPGVNLKLRPQLWRQLKTGTRVVSHIWDMGPAWPPERTELIRGRKVHYWTITEAQKNAVRK